MNKGIRVLKKIFGWIFLIMGIINVIGWPPANKLVGLIATLIFFTLAFLLLKK